MLIHNGTITHSSVSYFSRFYTNLTSNFLFVASALADYEPLLNRHPKLGKYRENKVNYDSITTIYKFIH